MPSFVRFGELAEARTYGSMTVSAALQTAEQRTVTGRSGSVALSGVWRLSGVGISLTAFKRRIWREDGRIGAPSSPTPHAQESWRSFRQRAVVEQELKPAQIAILLNKGHGDDPIQ